jgi:hypothetical protein
MPGADIVKARVDHGVSNVTFSTWFAGGTDPVTDPIRFQPTSRILWWVDTTGDGDSDIGVDVQVVDGKYTGLLWADSDATEPTCTAAATYDQATFRHRVSFPRTCLGNPASFRFADFSSLGVDLLHQLVSRKHTDDAAPVLHRFGGPLRRKLIDTFFERGNAFFKLFNRFC